MFTPVCCALPLCIDYLSRTEVDCTERMSFLSVRSHKCLSGADIIPSRSFLECNGFGFHKSLAVNVYCFFTSSLWLMMCRHIAFLMSHTMMFNDGYRIALEGENLNRDLWLSLPARKRTKVALVDMESNTQPQGGTPVASPPSQAAIILFKCN